MTMRIWLSSMLPWLLEFIRFVNVATSPCNLSYSRWNRRFDRWCAPKSFKAALFWVSLSVKSNGCWCIYFKYASLRTWDWVNKLFCLDLAAVTYGKVNAHKMRVGWQLKKFDPVAEQCTQFPTLNGLDHRGYVRHVSHRSENASEKFKSVDELKAHWSTTERKKPRGKESYRAPACRTKGDKLHTQYEVGIPRGTCTKLQPHPVSFYSADSKLWPNMDTRETNHGTKMKFKRQTKCSHACGACGAFCACVVEPGQRLVPLVREVIEPDRKSGPHDPDLTNLTNDNDSGSRALQWIGLAWWSCVLPSHGRWR